MPTFDGGHCFLTALLPIKTGEIVDRDGMKSSHVHMVRDALAVLPTARQSPVTMALPCSPFAKDTRTHFARMAVIENVIFNGRSATNPILDFSDPLIGQPVDELPCPYLMLVIDFDAPNGTRAELKKYLSDMSTNMGTDLDPVFTHCFGYSKSDGASGFANYIMSCQVETTMSFNDYYDLIAGPKLPDATSTAYKLGVGSWLVSIAALSVVFYLLNLIPTPAWSLVYVLKGIGVTALILVLAALLAAGPAAYLLYRLAMARGAKSFPVAPNADLPSILKALYLQRQLIGFAIKTQGMNDGALQQEFAAFLEIHRVADLHGPTQEAGSVYI